MRDSGSETRGSAGNSTLTSLHGSFSPAPSAAHCPPLAPHGSLPMTHCWLPSVHWGLAISVAGEPPIPRGDFSGLPAASVADEPPIPRLLSALSRLAAGVGVFSSDASTPLKMSESDKAGGFSGSVCRVGPAAGGESTVHRSAGRSGGFLDAGRAGWGGIATGVVSCC